MLLVEDHPWSARLLLALLTTGGFETRHASDGRAALPLAAIFRPHLVLMDLDLPDTTGLALTSALKASAATRDCVVVVLTAHEPEAVAPALRAAGAAGVLAKPVDTQGFAETLRGYLPK